MSAKVLKVGRLTPRDLAPGGLLAGRVTKRETRSYVTGAQTRYEGEFTYWPPSGLPITSERLLLPAKLDLPNYPLPDAWAGGDFAGYIDHAQGGSGWIAHNCSPVAVDLAADIARALLPAAAKQLGFSL